MKRRNVLLALAAFTLVACGGDGKSRPAPEPPWTGAPVAVVVDQVTPPETLQVSLYNFSDKKTATYMLLFRYYDKDGNLLKVQPGTSFEKDHDFMSVSGRSYVAPSKGWVSFELDHMNVPANAVRAEGVVGSVTAVGPDGLHMEENPMFELEDGWMHWPEKK